MFNNIWVGGELRPPTPRSAALHHNEEERALDLYHWVSAAAAPIPSNQFSADLPVCAVQVYTVHSTANTTE